MNIGIVKYIGTIIEGYNKNKFQPGETYQFKNNIPGQYEIYDMSGKTLIDTIGLRTFNKCFEGLMLSKKKYQPKYFDWDTDEEFPYEEIDQHPEWYEHEYDNNGNTIYYSTSYGYWEKREYDENGNEIYYEDSDGYIIDDRDQIQEGLMLPYKKHYEPKPDTEMASLFFTLQNLTFAEYVDEIIYTEDDKIQISKNNKTVTISEQQGNFIVTMFLNDDIIKEKSFDSTTDKIYWMDIEDAVDSFLYDPNEPLHEGLMLPYKKKYSPAEKWFKDLLNQITVYNSPYYPDSIFFHINKEVYMEYNKNSKALYYNLKKIEWFLKSEFGISSYQINDLVHEMIEKHYELEVNVVLSVFLPNIA